MTAIDVLREYAQAIRGNWNIDGRTVKADLEWIADQIEGNLHELDEKERRELRLCSGICPRGEGCWTGSLDICDKCEDEECPK